MNTFDKEAGQNDLKIMKVKDGNSRRTFLKKAGNFGLASSMGLGLMSCESDNAEAKNVNINFNENFYWKMLTTWPPNFPILGEACTLFSKWVEEMSGGRMEIRVFGGGEIVPALEVFDAVGNGIAELGNGSPYYWAGKIPASQIFAAVPFGMNARQINAWINQANGGKLWEELYKPHGLIPVLSGNTGVQMGGWFNKKLVSVDDLSGLKMRIPGLGGKVFTRSGGTSVLVAGGEIFTNLERGVIDATEWIGPYHDFLMGFHKIARYYYFPGWHETGTTFESLINSKSFQKLPTDLKAIVKYGLKLMNEWVLSAFDNMNSQYLEKIKSESNVEILPYPDEILSLYRKNTQEIMQDLSSEDKNFEKIYQDYLNFRSIIKDWSDISDRAYFEKLNTWK